MCGKKPFLDLPEEETKNKCFSGFSHVSADIHELHVIYTVDMRNVHHGAGACSVHSRTKKLTLCTLFYPMGAVFRVWIPFCKGESTRNFFQLNVAVILMTGCSFFCSLAEER